MAKLPEAPIHLLWALEMDFSPMHPDVWASTDAERWNYYLQLRTAFEDGREKVKHRRGDAEKQRKGMADLIARAGAKESHGR